MNKEWNKSFFAKKVENMNAPKRPSYNLKGLRSRDEQLEEAGWKYCDAHNKWFDPKKYDQCYFCTFPSRCKNPECDKRVKADFDYCFECAHKKEK